MIRAVLFDAAGTLIETSEPVGDTYARVAEAHGVSLPPDRLGDAFARMLRQAPAMVFPAAAGEVEALERRWWWERVRATFRAADGTARFEDFDAFFDEVYRAFATPGTWRLRPGSRQALLALRRSGITTGVVSNFDRRLHVILRDLELLPLLDVVVLPSDAGAAKPDPKIFTLALERAGATALETVFVGDDVAHDIDPARAAGLRAIDVGSLATLAELPARISADSEPVP